MSTAALDFTYRYAFASEVDESPSGFGLRLATCGEQHQQPYFFDGRLLAPRETGEMLFVLSDVVRTHFFLPRPALLDPIVTSNESLIRFEGFSGCCGVYARVDIPAEAFDCDHLAKGTTNVDFNDPMRAALMRLRDHNEARLSVGSDQVQLTSGNSKVVEKKVKLPVRWIKGLSEVQVYQPLLELKLEVSASEARKFIRSLPKSGAPKRPSYVSKLGRAIRLSQRESKDTIRFHGTHRVRVLEPLMHSAKGLRIWSDTESGVTAWEVTLRAGRFFLMLSPEVYRGFSGEGQVLQKLAGENWKNALPAVQDQLQHQAVIDADDLARETGFPRNEVEAALAVLGSRGITGYDATRGAFFHRQLPFALDRVEELQPRLKNARKLIENNAVRILSSDTTIPATEFEVDGSGTTQRVRLSDQGDKCSCPWFSKHQGQRGPCKHILASKLFLDPSEDESE